MVDAQVKVLIVGGAKVGKTTLFHQLVSGQGTPRSGSSIRDCSKVIAVKNLQLDIHDCLVSSPKSLFSNSWRNVNAVIYVFSFEDIRSLHEALIWFHHVREDIQYDNIHQILVGNKKDMLKMSEQTSFGRTKSEIIKEIGISQTDVFDTTAATGEGVGDIKERIAQKFRNYASSRPFGPSLRLVPQHSSPGCMCISS